MSTKAAITELYAGVGMIRDFDATMVRWIDGDTCEVDVDLGFSTYTRVQLRILELDTPEKDQPGHDEAWRYAEKLIPAGTVVRIHTQKAPKRPDTFTRYLAAITSPKGDFASLMRAKGWHNFVPGLHKMNPTKEN